MKRISKKEGIESDRAYPDARQLEELLLHVHSIAEQALQYKQERKAWNRKRQRQ